MSLEFSGKALYFFSKGPKTTAGAGALYSVPPIENRVNSLKHFWDYIEILYFTVSFPFGHINFFSLLLSLMYILHFIPVSQSLSFFFYLATKTRKQKRKELLEKKQNRESQNRVHERIQATETKKKLRKQGGKK